MAPQNLDSVRILLSKVMGRMIDSCEKKIATGVCQSVDEAIPLILEYEWQDGSTEKDVLERELLERMCIVADGSYNRFDVEANEDFNGMDEITSNGF